MTGSCKGAAKPAPGAVPVPLAGQVMHRRGLIDRLTAYAPADAEQVATARRIRDFVAANADCFERSLRVGHVTGAAWIVDRERTRALLTHHRKLDRWLQLGGHADGDPDVLAVALREAHEESGLDELRVVSEEIFDVDVHPIPARGDEPAHLHYDVRFLLEASPAEPLTISVESKSLAWVALDEVAALNADRSVLRMVEKSACR